MLCQSYIRDTIGLYNVDSVITTGKSEIQSEIKQKVTARLETEDLGLQITSITIQDAGRPRQEVQQAFTAVETAKQAADTAVNNWKNTPTRSSRGGGPTPTRSSSGRKPIRTKIKVAAGQPRASRSCSSEYQKYPLITKQRLFYEAMGASCPT